MNRMTRRIWVSGGVVFAAQTTQASYAYVGCYTSEQRKARGDGIHVYRVDPQTGAWTHVQVVGNQINPSFLALSPDRRHLYSVHGDESYATSFSVDRATGRLTQMSRTETGGSNGVHLAFAPGGKFLVIANYTSGNVAVLPVRSDGSLGDLVQLVTLEGRPGPNRIEQSSSHPHQVVFDPSGQFVIVPDKGLDRIFIFRFDRGSGRLTPAAQGSVATRAGAGPRHAAFHPTLPVAWVLNELNSTIVTYRLDPGTGGLQPVRILSTLPSDYTGENTGAEIAVSPGGQFVYCSNRGHDSIAIFSADARTGLLTFTGWIPSRGRIPRYIGFDPPGRFLYAANEQSDTVVAWRADAATGKLTSTGHVVHNASPVSIAFGSWGA
jgi:6-phosphogluconolactonase